MAAVRLRATSVSPSYLVGLRDLRDAVRADPLAAARVDGDHLTADGRADGVALERRVGGLELRPRDVDLELRLVADRGPASSSASSPTLAPAPSRAISCSARLGSPFST